MEIDERSTQLAIALAGSGWTGEAAQELFRRFEEAKRQIRGEIEGREAEEREPEPQIALSAEEFRKQVGE